LLYLIIIGKANWISTRSTKIC